MLIGEIRMETLENEIQELGLEELIIKYSKEITEAEKKLNKNPNNEKVQKNYYALLKDFSMLLKNREATKLLEEKNDDEKVVVEFINLKSYAEYKKGLKK